MVDRTVLKINKKYTIVLDQDVTFKFYATRNGECWRDLTGDNLILAMFQQSLFKEQECEELEAKLKVAEKMNEIFADRYAEQTLCECCEYYEADCEEKGCQNKMFTIIKAQALEQIERCE